MHQESKLELETSIKALSKASYSNLGRMYESGSTV